MDEKSNEYLDRLIFWIFWIFWKISHCQNFQNLQNFQFFYAGLRPILFLHTNIEIDRA